MVKVVIDLGTLFPLSLCAQTHIPLEDLAHLPLGFLQESLAIAIAGDARN
jgi:hypothetical protein